MGGWLLEPVEISRRQDSRGWVVNCLDSSNRPLSSSPQRGTYPSRLRTGPTRSARDRDGSRLDCQIATFRLQRQPRSSEKLTYPFFRLASLSLSPRHPADIIQEQKRCRIRSGSASSAISLSQLDDAHLAPIFGRHPSDRVPTSPSVRTTSPPCFAYIAHSGPYSGHPGCFPAFPTARQSASRGSR